MGRWVRVQQEAATAKKKILTIIMIFKKGSNFQVKFTFQNYSHIHNFPISKNIVLKKNEMFEITFFKNRIFVHKT